MRDQGLYPFRFIPRVESLEFSVNLASSFSRKPPVSESVVNGLSIAFSVECLCYRLLNDQFTGRRAELFRPDD